MHTLRACLMLAAGTAALAAAGCGIKGPLVLPPATPAAKTTAPSTTLPAPATDASANAPEAPRKP
jgi:predicted small lipoprotein YifL